MFCSYTILHHMFIIIWNFWVILLFFYSLTHHKCGLCSRIIYAGLKRGISFNASLRISLEFISQICILLSTKSPGDEGQNHTVTHTHMHIKFQNEWKKRKKQGTIKEKYLIQPYLNQEEDFHFSVPHTTSLCLMVKPEIIIVLMKCRTIEKLFQRAGTSSECMTEETVSMWQEK